MKKVVPLLLFALVFAAGCRRGHDKIGDAPRTEQPSSTSGWKELSSSGVAIQLPEDWKTISLDRETMEAGAKRVFGDDPKYAALKAQTSSLSQNGLVKVISFDTTSLGSGFGTNCNIVVQDVPSSVTLEIAANSTVQQIAAIVKPGTQPRLEYVTLKSGRAAKLRSQIAPNSPAIPPLVSLAYLCLKGGKLAVITFTYPESTETRIGPIAEQAMGGFRFTK